MKITNILYVILIIGVALSLTFPFVLGQKKTQTYETNKKDELANAKEEVKKEKEIKTEPKTENIEQKQEETTSELAVATPEEKKEIVEPISTPEVVAAEGEALYGGYTLAEIETKLNNSLHSNLTGMGGVFLKYSVENGVDPFLAVAITLHETGCNWQCSAQVTQCNNVGGMKGAGGCMGTSYAKFPTLEEGIQTFIVNLKKNYYDYGLTTPEQMNRKYAASTAWAGKINSYMNQIKSS